MPNTKSMFPVTFGWFSLYNDGADSFIIKYGSDFPSPFSFGGQIIGSLYHGFSSIDSSGSAGIPSNYSFLSSHTHVSCSWRESSHFISSESIHQLESAHQFWYAILKCNNVVCSGHWDVQPSLFFGGHPYYWRSIWSGYDTACILKMSANSTKYEIKKEKNITAVVFATFIGSPFAHLGDTDPPKICCLVALTCGDLTQSKYDILNAVLLYFFQIKVKVAHHNKTFTTGKEFIVVQYQPTNSSTNRSHGNCKFGWSIIAIQ